MHTSHERVNAHASGFVVFIQRAEWLCEQGGIEFTAILRPKRDGAAHKWRVQKSRDSLRVMVCKCVEPYFTPGLSIERCTLIRGKPVAPRGRASIQVQAHH